MFHHLPRKQSLLLHFFILQILCQPFCVPALGGKGNTVVNEDLAV